MRLFGATFVALLASGAATAQPSMNLGDGASPCEEHGFITREWVWSNGTATTTFSAYGPADEVNQLDPQGLTPFCEDCELASSVQYEPADEVAQD